jgi:hypothetical protein
MPKNKTISDELKFIAPVLAASSPGHPYQVPPGYFEEFGHKLLQRIKSVPGEKVPGFSETKVNHPFLVPDGYFMHLPAIILGRVKNDQPLSSSDELEALSPLLSSLNKKLPFSLPEGYFEEMPSNVVAGIQAIDFVQTELEILSPALASARNKNTFKVPVDYFEELPGKILNKVKKHGSLVKGNFGTRVFRMATAAAVIGILALSAWLFTRNDITPAPAQSIAAELDSSIKTVSDSAISNYVNNNTVSLPEPTLNSSATADNDMKDMLAEVSDQDIRAYLQKYGIATEDQTN